MGTAQRIGVGVIGLAMLTTVSLPDRVFYKVLDVGLRGLERLLGTAMGTRRG